LGAHGEERGGGIPWRPTTYSLFNIDFKQRSRHGNWREMFRVGVLDMRADNYDFSDAGLHFALGGQRINERSTVVL